MPRHLVLGDTHLEPRHVLDRGDWTSGIVEIAIPNKTVGQQMHVCRGLKLRCEIAPHLTFEHAVSMLLVLKDVGQNERVHQRKMR